MTETAQIELVGLQNLREVGRGGWGAVIKGRKKVVKNDKGSRGAIEENDEAVN